MAAPRPTVRNQSRLPHKAPLGPNFARRTRCHMAQGMVSHLRALVIAEAFHLHPLGWRRTAPTKLRVMFAIRRLMTKPISLTHDHSQVTAPPCISPDGTFQQKSKRKNIASVRHALVRNATAGQWGHTAADQFRAQLILGLVTPGSARSACPRTAASRLSTTLSLRRFGTSPRSPSLEWIAL